MQKLRPYIMLGLFLFHLVLLCVMIFTVPIDRSGWDSIYLQLLWVFTIRVPYSVSFF